MTAKPMLDYARANFGQQQDRSDDARADDTLQSRDLSSDPIPMPDLTQPTAPSKGRVTVRCYITNILQFDNLFKALSSRAEPVRKLYCTSPD